VPQPDQFRQTTPFDEVGMERAIVALSYFICS
jgi:hypothetical protein